MNSQHRQCKESKQYSHRTLIRVSWCGFIRIPSWAATLPKYVGNRSLDVIRVDPIHSEKYTAQHKDYRSDTDDKTYRYCLRHKHFWFCPKVACNSVRAALCNEQEFGNWRLVSCGWPLEVHISHHDAKGMLDLMSWFMSMRNFRKLHVMLMPATPYCAYRTHYLNLARIVPYDLSFNEQVFPTQIQPIQKACDPPNMMTQSHGCRVMM